jgi:hypothetical protein
MKITVPITLIPKLAELGIIPNNRRIDIDDFIRASFALRKKSEIPEDLAQWMNLTANKVNIDPSKYEAIIDILAFPYGGHNEDRDCAGEFFHAGTDFKEAALPYPPVIHVHGYDVDGTGNAETTVVGETLRRWKDEAGGWAKVGIYRDTPYTENIIKAWDKGVLMASSTALLKKLNPSIDGQIDVWLAGEISTITPDSGITPCNFLASAKARKSAEEVREIAEGQEEPYRSRLLEMLNESEAPIASNTEPVNPQSEPDDNSGEVDFPEDENMPFTEEQLGQITKVVQDVLAAATPPATPPTPESVADPDPTPELDNRQKGDMASFLKERAATATQTATINKEAITLVDGWINAGNISPDQRADTLQALADAIETDGRKKSGTKAVEAFCRIIESRQVVDAKGLLGFGKNPTKTDEPAPDENIVKLMSAAAME